MKTLRRVIITIVVLIAVFIALKELKGELIDLYAHHFYVRSTPLPATETPDQILLTWSDTAAATQTVQWRAAPSIDKGVVQYRTEDAGDATPREIEAERSVIEDRLLENDPVNHRFTAVLDGLTPSTAYAYRAGHPELDEWSEWARFETAPAGSEPFSFMYLGDVQRGFESWGSLMLAGYERFEDIAFCLIAGDLVDDGGWRDEWDRFFAAGAPMFMETPLMAALGNHDYDNHARMYLELLALPENGPDTLPKEKAYSFEYANALFVVLDTNRSPAKQADWLEEQLAGSGAKWKFAMYHHPAYSSAPHRDNDEVREHWVPLFDEYHLDMAFQGHDHAYLRTYPMRGNQIVDSPAEGTYYIVSVAGTKMYEQEDHDYAEVAFPDVATYQIIGIDTEPDRLTYRAYDRDGAVRDEVMIEK